MPVQGLHLITPSAAVATGTGSSATINSQGSVSFSAITGLELRGIFSADYDNYKIVCRLTQASSNSTFTGQMVSGSTVASAADYSYQTLTANNTSVSGASQGPLASFGIQDVLQNPQGFVMFVYEPYVATQTTGRALGMYRFNTISSYESAWRHSLATSYDGMKFSNAAGSTSGRISVYGMRK